MPNMVLQDIQTDASYIQPCTYSTRKTRGSAPLMANASGPTGDSNSLLRQNGPSPGDGRAISYGSFVAIDTRSNALDFESEMESASTTATGSTVKRESTTEGRERESPYLSGTSKQRFWFLYCGILLQYFVGHLIVDIDTPSVNTLLTQQTLHRSLASTAR
jgi:hypothetical protein